MNNNLVPTSFKWSGQGKAILTITHDGRIEVGEGLAPDEAGRQAIEGMRSQLGFILKKARDDEREACARLIEAMDRTDTAKAFYADFDEAKVIFAAAIRAGL